MAKVGNIENMKAQFLSCGVAAMRHMVVVRNLLTALRSDSYCCCTEQLYFLCAPFLLSLLLLLLHCWYGTALPRGKIKDGSAFHSCWSGHDFRPDMMSSDGDSLVFLITAKSQSSRAVWNLLHNLKTTPYTQVKYSTLLCNNQLYLHLQNQHLFLQWEEIILSSTATEVASSFTSSNHSGVDSIGLCTGPELELLAG